MGEKQSRKLLILGEKYEWTKPVEYFLNHKGGQRGNFEMWPGAVEDRDDLTMRVVQGNFGLVIARLDGNWIVPVATRLAERSQRVVGLVYEPLTDGRKELENILYGAGVGVIVQGISDHIDGVYKKALEGLTDEGFRRIRNASQGI